jgi:hypothetical protein
MKMLLPSVPYSLLPASAGDISGTWNAAIETSKGTIETTLRLQTDGNKPACSASNQFMRESTIPDRTIEMTAKRAS